MKKLLSVIALTVFLLLLVSCNSQYMNETFEMPSEYELAYEDNFDKEIDTSYWKVSDFTPRKGGYWSPEQVFIRDGNLVIATNYVENGKYSGYYTGEISWYNRRVTYGYYEIRCKVDDIRGAWSAFWLMPDNISNMEQKAQDGCEIDIFEVAVRNKIQNTLHYDGYKAQKKRITDVKNLYGEYHTFALDWKKDGLKFYYDGKLTWAVKDPDLISHYPVSVDISTEVNGDIKDGMGTPNPLFWIGCGDIRDKKNNLPSEFMIDYVRIYDNGYLEWSELTEN